MNPLQFVITTICIGLLAVSLYYFVTAPSLSLGYILFFLGLIPLIYYYIFSGNDRLYNILCCSMKNIRNYNWYSQTWFYMIMAVVILLVIILTSIYHPDHAKNVLPISTPSISSNTAVIIESLIAAVILIYIVYSFKQYIPQFANVIILGLFIFGVIVLFTALSKSQINTYAYLILPITLIIGCYLFYRIPSENLVPYRGEGDILLIERIKYIITFVLLIVFMSIYYAVDPGGYIAQYFGLALTFGIIIAVFSLFYLLSLLTFPTITTAAADLPGRSDNPLLSGFSTFGIFSAIGFITFLIIYTSIVVTWPGGFMNNYGTNQTVMILIGVVLTILWLISFLVSGTPSGYNTAETTNNLSGMFAGINNTLKRTLLVLFGLVISAMLIAWLVTTLQNISTSSGIGSLILNIIVVIAVLAIMYKIITMGSIYRENSVFKLIINVILYIPCIAVIILDKLISGIYAAKTYLPKMSSGPTSKSLGLPRFAPDTFSTGTPDSPYAYVILLAIIICVYIGFFMWPYLVRWFSKQGGKLLINQPVYLNSQQTIGTYQSLNGSSATTATTAAPTFDYQYAISCWVFIDASTPNTNTSYTAYTSLLNYGGKPNILYNVGENTLRITMPPDGRTPSNSSTTATTSSKDKSKLPEVDDNGNVIVYKKRGILLQKWNNIIINYNGGTLDIFYNGELVKTVVEVVPYMTLDTLTVGTDNGIHGGICNVNYFDKSLDIQQIYYLYNMVKDKTPPTVMDTNITLTDIAVDLDIPLDFSLGNIDTAIIAPIGGAIVDASNNVLPYVEPPNLNIYEPNYLSLEWYFKHGRSPSNIMPPPHATTATTTTTTTSTQK